MRILQIGGPYEPVICIDLLQMNLNLLFGPTLESDVYKRQL